MLTQTKSKTDLSAEDVVREVYDQIVARNYARPVMFTEKLPDSPFFGVVSCIINEVFDSYEGESFANMNYRKADVFRFEGKHYALAHGIAGSGRCQTPFTADIALLALDVPRLSRNPLIRFFQGLSSEAVEQDIEKEIIQQLACGHYFKNTVLAIKRPGLLKFDQELRMRLRFGRQPEYSPIAIRVFPGAAQEIRKRVEAKFCPRVQEFMMQVAEIGEGYTRGQIKYSPKVIPELVTIIEGSIKEHARTLKE